MLAAVWCVTASPLRDEIVIKTGSWVGGLLVDGLGDGAMIEVEGEDLDFLRTTSFGLLQVRSGLCCIAPVLCCGGGGGALHCFGMQCAVPRSWEKGSWVCRPGMPA